MKAGEGHTCALDATGAGYCWGLNEYGQLGDGTKAPRLTPTPVGGGLITKVFRASRNHERDQPAEAWVAEFERKARTIIDARCSN